jgi:hypothetical protein
MSAIVTEHFRRNNALSFLNDIKNTQNKYYLGIGKSDKWEANETSLTLDIPLPTGTYAEEVDVLSNLISCIKINQSNIGLVMPKVNFNIGFKYKVYSPYDLDCIYPSIVDGVTLNPCYASLDDRIYLCLANGDGAVTSAAPTSRDYRAIKNSDGYVWILVDDTTKLFNTDQFISVASGTAEPSLINNIKKDCGGLLYGFSVKNGGTGYTGVTSATFTANHEEISTLVEFTCGITVVDGVITSVSLPSNYNYDLESSKKILGGTFTISTGSGAVIVPHIAPTFGFAYEPSRTLPAWYAGVSVNVVDSISDDGFYIPYRQISIIKNLEINNENTIDTLGALQYLVISSAPAVTTQVGDIISFNSSVTKAYFDAYAAVDVDGTTEHRIYFHQNSVTGFGNIPDIGTFTNTSSPGTAIGYSSVQEGEYVQQSGDVVFTENRRPIIRQSGQTEEIKIIIQF